MIGPSAASCPPFELIPLFFELGKLAFELRSFAYKQAEPPGQSAKFADFGVQLLLLAPKVGDEARFPRGIENSIARAFQLPQHLDVRNPIQAGSQIIKQFGGRRVAKHG